MSAAAGASKGSRPLGPTPHPSKQIKDPTLFFRVGVVSPGRWVKHKLCYHGHFGNLLQKRGGKFKGPKDAQGYIEEKHADRTACTWEYILKSDRKVIPKTRIDSIRSAAGII